MRNRCALYRAHFQTEDKEFIRVEWITRELPDLLATIKVRDAQVLSVHLVLYSQGRWLA